MTQSSNILNKFIEYELISNTVVKADSIRKVFPQETRKRTSELIININKILTIILILSFLTIVFYPFIYPEKPIPDIAQNAFFLTLGWFGSALALFLRFDDKDLSYLPYKNENERDTEYNNYQFQWEIFIKFSGNNFQASKIFQLLFLLSETLENISGVSVEIESQGIGSLWVKLKIFIKDAFQKEEVKEVLNKTRDAIVAEQLDKRIEENKKLEEETLKTKAERRNIEKQNEVLPNTQEAKKLRELEIQRKELENKEKAVDIERKEIENQQKKLELYEKLAYMMQEGMLTGAPVDIQINGLPFLNSNDETIVSGADINAIDEQGITNPDVDQ